MAVALLGAGITVHAQTSAKDSMRVVNLQEVQVVSTRATAKTPVAFTNIGKAELKKVNFGQDIPYPAKYDSFHTDHIGCRSWYRLYDTSRTWNRWHTNQHHGKRHTDERCRKP